VSNILDRILSIQTNDEQLARKGRLLNAVILLLLAGDLLTLLHDIVYGSVNPGYLSAEVLSFAGLGALYWYTRRTYCNSSTCRFSLAVHPCSSRGSHHDLRTQRHKWQSTPQSHGDAYSRASRSGLLVIQPNS
jgi:hypothetical protein